MLGTMAPMALRPPLLSFVESGNHDLAASNGQREHFQVTDEMKYKRGHWCSYFIAEFVHFIRLPSL